MHNIILTPISSISERKGKPISTPRGLFKINHTNNVKKNQLLKADMIFNALEEFKEDSLSDANLKERYAQEQEENNSPSNIFKLIHTHNSKATFADKNLTENKLSAKQNCTAAISYGIFQASNNSSLQGKGQTHSFMLSNKETNFIGIPSSWNSKGKQDSTSGAYTNTEIGEQRSGPISLCTFNLQDIPATPILDPAKLRNLSYFAKEETLSRKISEFSFKGSAYIPFLEDSQLPLPTEPESLFDNCNHLSAGQQSKKLLKKLIANLDLASQLKQKNKLQVPTIITQLPCSCAIDHIPLFLLEQIQDISKLKEVLSNIQSNNVNFKRLSLRSLESPIDTLFQKGFGDVKKESYKIIQIGSLSLMHDSIPYFEQVLANSSQVSSSSKELLAQLIETLVEKITFMQTEQTQTVSISLSQEGVFKGAVISIIQTSSAPTEYNIQFGQLSSLAQDLIDKNLIQLKSQLKAKGIVVQQIVSERNDISFQKESLDYRYQNSKSGQHSDHQQQSNGQGGSKQQQQSQKRHQKKEFKI
ncbi:MAG: hypothetical protein K0S74_1604 [Chlamydiales bacterium]|jgi:hypothetical protein|nr:hypothetical protein [Chlamydiales bacterium]